MEGTAKNKYIRWILKEVGCGPEDMKKYKLLFKQLFETEFTWIIPRDDNRLSDGLRLRRDFDRQFDTYISDSDYPCSVLEMLIALAIRMENDILGDPTDEHPEKWFWIMLDNLGLLGYSDAVFGSIASAEINEKVQKFLAREIDRDGKGGIFPIKGTKNDQRKVEIWYQMQEFIG